MNTKFSLHAVALATAMLLMIASGCSKDDDGISRTVTDIDGNVYHTVQIGDQIWMVENLKVTTYNDGSPITHVIENEGWVDLTTEAFCCYEDDENNVEKYGCLYNWYAVNSGKLAPAGWHVPSLEEWTAMTSYLTLNGYGFVDNHWAIGKSMADTTGWVLSGNDYDVGHEQSTNNTSGFTLVPGGVREFNFGSSMDMGYAGTLWLADEFPGLTHYAYAARLTFQSTDVSESDQNKSFGFSVRCIKD